MTGMLAQDLISSLLMAVVPIDFCSMCLQTCGGSLEEAFQRFLLDLPSKEKLLAAQRLSGLWLAGLRSWIDLWADVTCLKSDQSRATSSISLHKCGRPEL